MTGGAEAAQSDDNYFILFVTQQMFYNSHLVLNAISGMCRKSSH